MRRTLAVLTWCLLVAYPVIVYFGLSLAHTGWLGGFFILLALARFVLFREQGRNGLILLLLSLLLLLAGVHALLSGGAGGLRFYPVAVNLTLLVAFAASLFQQQTVIERIARIQEPALPPTAVAYTRKVTISWCVFFLVNGTIALYTTLWASLETWTLYNGLIAYLMIGLMLGAEWLVRQRVKQSGHD